MEANALIPSLPIPLALQRDLAVRLPILAIPRPAAGHISCALRFTDPAHENEAVADDADGPSASTGTVAPLLGTLPIETTSDLLESNNGPVAQKDRAAVS